METLIKESSRKSIMKNQINWANSFEISEQLSDVKSELIGVLSRLQSHEEGRVNPDQQKLAQWSQQYDYYVDYFSHDNLMKLDFPTEQAGQNYVDELYKVLNPLLEEEEKYFQDEE
jgi:ABC-type transport system involved in cytochrome c biogenesis ATPase subunit